MKKHILQENYERFFGKRKFGEPLPTLKDVVEKYQSKDINMFKLKDLIVEATKHGFDLTDFKSGGFKKVLKELRIRPKSKHMGNKGFYWKGSGILIVTGNDPLTGQFSQPDRRKSEKNYASFIGVEGKSDTVEKAVDLIKKYASYIKGESPGRREYI